jgi:type VI secretion system secreted protein Hcp
MTRIARTRTWMLGLTAGTVFLFAASGTMAQSVGYIKLVTAQGALDGASKDPAHLNWIPLTAAQIGDLDGDGAPDLASSTRPAPGTAAAEGVKPVAGPLSSGQKGQATTAVESQPRMPRDAASGMATGKRMHKPITITKEWGASSPLLAKLMASGTPIPTVEIDLLTNTGKAKAGHYKLTEVMITAIQPAGGGGKTPQLETVSFTYQKIEWTN